MGIVNQESNSKERETDSPQFKGVIDNQVKKYKGSRYPKLTTGGRDGWLSPKFSMLIWILSGLIFFNIKPFKAWQEASGINVGLQTFVAVCLDFCEKDSYMFL